MKDIAEAIQQLTPEQKKFFFRKLKEDIAELMEKFEEEHKKMLKEGKVPKSLRQFIPYTDEAWEKEMEKQRQYKFLINDKHEQKKLKDVNTYLQKHLSELFE